MSEVGSILQWNMGCPSAQSAKKVESDTIARRCELVEIMLEEHTPTFVVLQEAPQQCANRLRGKLAKKYVVVDWHKGLITLYSANWTIFNNSVVQTERGILTVLDHRVLGNRVRLWNVHFWSLLRLTERDREEHVRFFCDAHLRRHREPAASDSATELIAGDFNLTPDDITVTAQGGLWANGSLLEATKAAKRAKRDPNKNLYRPLFNPMRELQGRIEPPQGTYYRGSSKVNGPWYTFDQTIMSPAHGLPQQAHVMLVEKIGGQPLWSNANIRHPDGKIGSDHFPVVVKFKLG